MKIRTQIQNLNNHQVFNKVKSLACEYLNKHKYQEIDLPVLSPVLIPESYLEIFKTELINGKKKEELYLTPSPELFLKRLIVQGLGSCYYLNKSFRNGDLGTSRHSPEFNILEFYKLGSSYMDVADETLKMMRFIAKKLFGKDEIIFQRRKISFKNLEKISVSQAFEKYAEMTNILDKDNFFKQAKNKGYVTNGFNYSEIWSQIYVQEVEPELGKKGKPTIIYDYPFEMAAIARFNKEKKVAERLEIYIEGVELGNCGNEVLDENKKTLNLKFNNEQKMRKKMKKFIYSPDKEFVNVIKELPWCSGIAIGLDRLAMIFANVPSIQDLKLIDFEY
ncbi:MAG: hypothetical protein HYW86_00770 [Candidatus Roizmanbacteria bacterium]|nr:MAG: hypothetical protein HYW86_00770 [Candidatus Roizmanbacteria bacterium]